MRAKIKIHPETGMTYISENIRDEGFKGEVEILANAKTVTLLHPDADLDEIEQSLRIVLKDIQLRRGKTSNQKK